MLACVHAKYSPERACTTDGGHTICPEDWEMRHLYVLQATPRRDLIKEAQGVTVEIAQPFGLQTIGDHAVEQMARQVIGGLAAEHRMPSCPQATEIEIAQMRDLVVQFAH